MKSPRVGRRMVSKLSRLSMCGDCCVGFVGEIESERCSSNVGSVEIEVVGGSRRPGSKMIVVMFVGEELEVVGSASSGL